jgi:hypothetical protein
MPKSDAIANNLLYNITYSYDLNFARNYLKLYPEGIVGF